ncbi:MAG: antirestriction protein ArdA [Alphaproteobacteria bacterium]|nr:antirestriction protein ArdA [Alphaproteobacteria bacterium]
MGTKHTETFAPKIYVACLAAYNNGILHGRWIDAYQDADDIRAAIADMLRESPIAGAEEYAIHDYEDFAGIAVEEYTGVDRVVELAAFAVEHGSLGAALFEHYGELQAAREAIEENYCGVYRALADYVEELTTETTDIPENLRAYIDWDAMARDAELNGDLLTVKTAWDEVHVFWAR